jgi:hypothetical protein
MMEPMTGSGSAGAGTYGRIARAMDIKGFIEWIGHDSGSAAATVFPYLLLGLVGLYFLWLLVGYLRVSQVGAGAEGHASPAPLPLPATPDDAVGRQRGVPMRATARAARATCSSTAPAAGPPSRRPTRAATTAAHAARSRPPDARAAPLTERLAQSPITEAA